MSRRIVRSILVAISLLGGSVAIDGADADELLGIGIEAAAIPSAQAWIQGRKDDGSWTLRGYEAVLRFNRYRSEGGPRLWGAYLSRGELINAYDETDASGAEATEYLRSWGIGAHGAIIGLESGVWVSGALGLETLRIEQSGDTPQTKTYGIGYNARIGVGYRTLPLGKLSGLILRADYQAKSFPSQRSDGDTLFPLMMQAFEPVVSINLMLE